MHTYIHTPVNRPNKSTTQNKTKQTKRTSETKKNTHSEQTHSTAPLPATSSTIHNTIHNTSTTFHECGATGHHWSLFIPEFLSELFFLHFFLTCSFFTST